MKKLNLLLIIICIFTFSSCRSLTSKGRSVNKAEKLIEQGDYYNSVNILVEVLQKNPDYVDALDTLREVYPMALDKKKILVQSLENSNNHIKLAEEKEKVLSLYNSLRLLKNEVLAYIGQSINYEEIQYWTVTSSESYYEAGIERSKISNNLKSYEEVALLFKKSYEILPTFEDSLEKYKEYKQLAMRRIIYFIPNYIFADNNLGEIIEKEFRINIDRSSNFNEFLSLNPSKNIYNTGDFEKIKDDYNIYINIKIMDFNYNPPVKTERRYTDYYYEKSYTENNIKYNEIVNSRPQKVEEGVTYKRYSYTKVKNEEHTSISMSLKYEIYDIENSILLREAFINKEVSDFDTWYTYYGHPIKHNDFNMGLKSKERLVEELCKNISENLSSEILKIIL